jgi:F-type H+-transporting ATPase subunit gamma
MLRQEVMHQQLLPLEPTVQADPQDILYEPSPETVLDFLLPRLVEVRLYQAVQEALASEHSSRRMAMHSATDNANEMLDDLTLTYNGLRQSAITQEIAEITSGAAALTT